jgi:hypothetical protein
MNGISKSGMKYIPNKKYYVVGARNAWDTVPVGLFCSKDDAHGNFPLSNANIIREATKKEIKDFFNLP